MWVSITYEWKCWMMVSHLHKSYDSHLVKEKVSIGFPIGHKTAFAFKKIKKASIFYKDMTNMSKSWGGGQAQDCSGSIPVCRGGAQHVLKGSLSSLV